jgi:hypothetical protein
MTTADPSNLALAVFFARAHGHGNIVFWRSSDWRLTYGVSARRTDPEHVLVTCRPIGPGGLIPR